MRAGWETKTLDEICTIARGGSPRPIKAYITDDPGGINWIKISDATASTKYIYSTAQRIKPEGITRSRMVNPGDFILSNSMSFGRPYIMRTSGCIHDGWLVLSDKSGVFDQDFLYYFLSSPVAYRQFDARAAGSTVRNLNIDLVKTVKVPLPPLPEQKRIVAILDEAFAAIDVAAAHAQTNLDNARELFESYLNAVFTQKGEGWVEKPLGELLVLITYGFTNPMPTTGDGPLLVTAKNVLGGRVDYQNARHTSQEAFDTLLTDKSRPELGDVLLTKDGSLGRVAVVERNGICVNQSVAVLRPRAEVEPGFLKHLLSSSFYQKQMIADAGGTTIKHIYISRVVKMKVSIPDRSIQQQVVSETEDFYSQTANLEALYNTKLAALAELKQSILQKAFAGELTADETVSQVEAVA